MNEKKQPLAVGDIVPVKKRFWIHEDAVIGFDEDAEHAHGLDAGHANMGCDLEVRGIEGDYAIVALRRPKTPSGAQAATGIVFKHPLSIVKLWHDPLAPARELQEERDRLAKLYCR